MKIASIGLGLLLCIPEPTPGAAQSAPMRYGAPISIDHAMALVRKGMSEAAAKGHKMAFAVVEPSGELVAFGRMDDVPYASIRLSQQKARTSARLRISTAIMEHRVTAGRTVLMSSDEVLAIAGGVPIIKDGLMVGAIGVSGATAAEDNSVAEAILSHP